jgi:tol-pal system protein YbgF
LALVLTLSLASTIAGPVFAAASFGPASPVPPANIADGRILVAQNQQNTAELLVRIQDLEGQIRTMTGQIEGLQFQLTQMQTLIERMTEDNEFRFQQLEGGAPGKPQAAVPTDGAMSSQPLSPDSTQTADVPAAADPAQPEAPAAGGAAPMDFALEDSQDPLLGGGVDQLGTLSEDQLTVAPARPLDLDQSGGLISAGDAAAQYQAGYDAMTRGDYTFAEEQFTQFIALYPDDPQAADATNWLGEALLQRGAYTDAAQVLADGYTKYRESRRAPDMLLKLGVALVGADQAEVGCRTFQTLRERYPELSTAFRQRLDEETQKAQCPPVG